MALEFQSHHHKEKTNWEELMIRIGSLPHLQHLRLSMEACMGPKWETIEGKFCSLKVMKIIHCIFFFYLFSPTTPNFACICSCSWDLGLDSADDDAEQH
ncbi:hypothetical protein ACS0TY_000224 [Phlomoides rotata]